MKTSKFTMEASQNNASTRETIEGWHLLTVETEENGDSKRTNDRCHFLCWFVGLVVPLQVIFALPQLLLSAQYKYIFPHGTLFRFLCPSVNPESWAGSRAGSPVFQCDVSGLNFVEHDYLIQPATSHGYYRVNEVKSAQRKGASCFFFISPLSKGRKKFDT